MPTINQRVLNFIRQNSLVPPNKPLLVAVSGGPDSVCLIHLLKSLQEDLGITIYIAHMDHQLRGEESDADALYVAEISRRLAIEPIIEARSIISYKNKYRLSLEEAAREVRYGFFVECAKSIGAEQVAVGHTQDDNIETIIMHLIRGSGTRGLRGLQPANIWRLGENQIKVIRPLLNISREETHEYCRVNNLAPRIDSTNLSLSPLRNKIRLQLLPLLHTYNSNFNGALLRAAKIAEADSDFLMVTAVKALGKTIKFKDSTAVINKEKFNTLHPAIQRQLLRMAIEKLLGNLKDIESRHIEEVLDALKKPAGKKLHLPYGLVFLIEYDRYLLGTKPFSISPFPPFEGEYSLKIPGKTNTGKWDVEIKILKREEIKKGNRFTAYFDFAKTGDQLFVRTLKNGDRFQPLGMTQQKKLGEFMIDSRIPHAWRNRIPIVFSREQMIWAVGFRMDDRVKITQKTDQILKIRYKRLK